MSYTRVAAVTGANKGIGYAIVRNLALTYPSSTLAGSATHPAPLLLYLTARSPERGAAAVEALSSDDALVRAKALRREGGPTEVRFAELDTSDASSVKAFVARMKSEHGSLDVVVQNAGVALDGFDADVVRRTIATNFGGTRDVVGGLLPVMREGGRVVVVSSMVGKLNKYGKDVEGRFRGAKSVKDVQALMEEYTTKVEKGRHEKDGWPSSAYAVSKAGTTGMVGVMGKELLGQNSGVLLNSCCPGYVNTDMTKGRGRHTPDEGARTPVKLALGDINGVSGEFWQNEEVSTW